MLDTIDTAATTENTASEQEVATTTATENAEGTTTEGTTESGENGDTTATEVRPTIKPFVMKTAEELAAMSVKERREHMKAHKDYMESIAALNDFDKGQNKKKSKDGRDALLKSILDLTSTMVVIEAAGVTKELSLEDALKGVYFKIPVKAPEGKTAAVPEEGDEVVDGMILRKHLFVLSGARTKALQANVDRLVAQMKNEAIRAPRTPRAKVDGEAPKATDNMLDGEAPKDNAPEGQDQPQG
jgi:hypothetical protein